MSTKLWTPIQGVAATKDDYSLESYILGNDHYQIELLTNLDQVPEAGAACSRFLPEEESCSGRVKAPTTAEPWRRPDGLSTASLRPDWHCSVASVPPVPLRGPNDWTCRIARGVFADDRRMNEWRSTSRGMSR